MGTRSRTDMEMWKLERLDNAALAALATPKPNATSKYNFYVKLGKGWLHALFIIQGDIKMYCSFCQIMDFPDLPFLQFYHFFIIFVFNCESFRRNI